MTVIRKITAGRERVLSFGLGIVLMVALVGGVALEVHTVHGSGTGGEGGGGLCQPVAGTPTCHFQGFSTVANYLQVNNAPDCQYGQGFTQFGLFAAQNVTHDPQSGQADTVLVSAFVSKFDCVTGAFEVLFGTITNANLTVIGNLDKASLDAVIPTADYDGNATGTITVSLQWQGVGTVNQAVTNQHIRTEHLTIQNHFVGDNRLAIVSGTFSDGTTTIPFSSETEMVSSQSGTVEIIQ